MRVEVLTIGSELLRGDVVDLNGAWLGRRLRATGIDVGRRVTVPDDETQIRAAIDDALERAGAVICSGGLGPTTDDRTREAAAAAFGAALHSDEGVLDSIRARFAARGISMPDINRRQAQVPAGARVLPNRHGTAPGLLLEDARGLAVLLPGVPHEFERLVDEIVIPLLHERWAGRLPRIDRAVLRTTGISESQLMEAVHDLVAPAAPVQVGFLPHVAGVDVHLTAHQDAPALERAGAAFRTRLAPWVYAEGEVDLAGCVGLALLERGWMLAVAESCTGGLIGQQVTAVPGSSAWFVGGWITYADAAKVRDLGVDPETLAHDGAVSEGVARQMAASARRRAGVECALAVTGIAGPGGGTPDKPVGTVWIAVDVRGAVQAQHFRFPGGRLEVRERAAQAALRMLQRAMMSAEPTVTGGVAPGVDP
jgi:nicotinamide-nucleotide amidase